uniref:Sulfotransferase n=1 Tax=Lactuca sativa TaxID=4236 RepID=A0A9R1XG37_LACSA|nr:hypothetical protein LSAT_V11C400201350 [Lactuca sativa]
MIHEYFHPKPTDIFLAAFMKCGTTRLRALMFATTNRHRYKISDYLLHHTGPHGRRNSHPFRLMKLTSFSTTGSPNTVHFGTMYWGTGKQARKKLAEFMGMPFTMEEEEGGVVEEIVKLCSFENLSNFKVNKDGVQMFRA